MSAGITALWLGRVDYVAAWQLQKELVAARSDDRIGDLLLLLEHPPTITLGRAHDPEHVLAQPEALARLGITVVETDRGGDVTYHGPGQLVGYPIVKLHGPGQDLHLFLRGIEATLACVLANYGVPAGPKPPHTGVWVDDRKIAAIGIKVSRWVTQHGFALNLDPDLHHFDLIVPCGIREFGVTRLSDELPNPPSMAGLLTSVAREFARVFGMQICHQGISTDGLSDESRRIIDSAAIVR